MGLHRGKRHLGAGLNGCDPRAAAECIAAATPRTLMADNGARTRIEDPEADS